MLANTPRIISMVPSWTETLIACEANVVGRTRFCIEPKDAVKNIPIIGGTKDINWEKAVDIKPDFILLDQEENPKWMNEGPLPSLCTHVTKISDVTRDVAAIASKIQNLGGEQAESAVKKLRALSDRWLKVQNSEAKKLNRWSDLPGVLNWIRMPDKEITQILYVIWHDPWMGVSKETFIGSVLERVGVGSMIPEFPKKYPILDFTMYDPKKTLLLFSSEPFPFHKKPELLQGLKNPMALVDGQSFSWFGIRTLNFLNTL